MRTFLAILLHCFLALGVGFVPVANAMNMAAMANQQQDLPPCHQHAKDKGTVAAGHCHCAMTVALPAGLPPLQHPATPSDHPQTVRQLPLALAASPDTPPPRPTR
ncbi:MAG: hypothetical protein AB1831_13475 [Pseudomonadota bacterium]